MTAQRWNVSRGTLSGKHQRHVLLQGVESLAVYDTGTFSVSSVAAPRIPTDKPCSFGKAKCYTDCDFYM